MYVLYENFNTFVTRKTMKLFTYPKHKLGWVWIKLKIVKFGKLAQEFHFQICLINPIK